MATTHVFPGLATRQELAPDPADIDFSSNAPRILAIVGTLTGLAALLLVLRCYVRIFLLRRFYVEDWIMVISVVRITFPITKTNIYRFRFVLVLTRLSVDVLLRRPRMLRRRKSPRLGPVQCRHRSQQ